MFGKTSPLSIGRRPFSLATGVAMAGALVLVGSSQVLAATAASSQTLAGTSSAGVLSVTAPAGLTLPSLVGGSSTAATNLGSLSWTDTLNSATASSVTLASTDLYFAAGVGGHIPFSNFTISVDQAPNANALNSGANAVAGAASQVLSGVDTTPGTTYSSPITLATASTTSVGTWNQAANKIAVGVPANTIPSSDFAATIQYTITG
ncbi:MAG: hypothetical protein QOK05_940 [Chloroflexota bacterium]|jgi:hypothetical protein|nr:hypothetical protein [Chloroflexota bacterium]